MIIQEIWNKLQQNSTFVPKIEKIDRDKWFGILVA